MGFENLHHQYCTEQVDNGELTFCLLEVGFRRTGRIRAQLKACALASEASTSFYFDDLQAEVATFCSDWMASTEMRSRRTLQSPGDFWNVNRIVSIFMDKIGCNENRHLYAKRS